MQHKAANRTDARKTTTTLAFRYPVARRRMLEAIHGEQKGEGVDLSVTLREMADQYIDNYLRQQAA